MSHLILYTKPDCHLCEDVESLLLSLEDEFDFVWERRDVTADAALYDRYRHAIPVVWIDGREALRTDEAPIDAASLRTLLAGWRPPVLPDRAV